MHKISAFRAEIMARARERRHRTKFKVALIHRWL